MVIVDYIVLIAFLVSVVVGFFRGFFKEALSLATWIIAIWLTWKFSWVVEPLFSGIESPALKIWAARLLVFIVVLILGALLNHFIGILVEKTGLSGTDRVLEFLAAEISCDTYLNIMDQYRPCYRADEHPSIDRPISSAEFRQALHWANEQGLTRLDKQYSYF